MAEEVTCVKRRVLLAIDGSKGSQNAFDWYVENMSQPSDIVLIVHLFGMPTLPVAGFGAAGVVLVDGYQEQVQTVYDKAMALASKYSTICSSKKIKNRTIVETVCGSAGSTICQIAKDEKANNIVMGSRGLGAVRRVFLGSVSTHVMHHAHIPVTIVPQKKE